MDCPPWLIWVFAGVVLFFGGQRAEAYPAVPQSTPNGYEYQGSNNGVWYSTPEEAGQNSVGIKPPGCTGFSIYHKVYIGVESSDGIAYVVRYQNAYCGTDQLLSQSTKGLGRRVAASLACPSGGTLSGSQCVCPAGMIDTGSACKSVQEQLCETKAGSTAWVTMNGGAPAIGDSICTDIGCMGEVGFSSTFTNRQTGVVVSEAEVLIKNTTCSYNPSAPNAPAGDGCKGGYFGEINGVPACVPYSGDQNTIETKKKSSSGTTTTTNNPDGTSTTTTSGSTGTESTKCDGGNCTSTTTTTKSNPDGSTVTEVITKTESTADFCKNNPTSLFCKAQEASSFTGSCGTGFTCTGDAAMCAAARATHEQRCLMSPSTDVQAVADQITGGTWAKASDLASTVRDVGAFDQSNPFSASCPSDQTVMAGSHSIVIPLSSVCSELQVMGNVLVAFTLLAATVFVLRGFGGST